MSLQFLEKRREIEGHYHKLELIRTQLKMLLRSNSEYLTLDNINILELEEEKILSRIVKLKTIS